MSNISKRVQNIKPSGIRKFFSLAAELDNPINLSIGQPNFEVPKELKQGFIDAIDQHAFSYTPTAGILPLRQKVYEKFRDRNHILCCQSPDDVLITAGVSGALFLAFSVLLDPGDEIIVNSPYFVIYTALAEYLGVDAKIIPTTENFDLNVEAMESAITDKTKLIIVNSPCNPTGKVYDEETLRQVATIAERNNIVILSDEIYEDFIYDGKKHFSIGSVYENTITMNGFSKALAIPGMRMGYVTAPKWIMEPMVNLSMYTYVCAPSLAQVATVKAFDIDLSDIIASYEKKRDIVYNTLKDHFELCKPEGSFYAYVKAPAGETADDFCQRALKSNVLVVPGTAFSTDNTHFRISFAADDEVLQQGMNTLVALVQK